MWSEEDNYKKVVAMWETTHWFFLFYCCNMHKGAHYLLFLVVATHVKELNKIIIFSCYHVQKNNCFFWLWCACQRSLLIIILLLWHTKQPRRQVDLMITYEWNDKRWMKLKCKTNSTSIILLVHVLVISVQVGLLYEFFIEII